MFAKKRNTIEKTYRKKILPTLEVVENFVEFVIFMWRWVLALPYIMLAFCLAILAFKTVTTAWSLKDGFIELEESMAIVKILGVVDMILVLNLIIMVLFVGYVNFVSKINLDNEDDRPSWMDSLDYSGLKIQLLGSIVAISSVQLLAQYMDMKESSSIDSTKFQWMIIFHTTFVLSVLIFAIVNRIYHTSSNHEDSQEAGLRLAEEEDEEDEDLPMLVAAVNKGKDGHIILNRGIRNQRKHDNLHPDQELTISSTGENIIDPTSGDIIGWQEDIIGTLKIERILEKTTIATPVGTLSQNAAVGDAVRPTPR
jgi:uncharacterized protein (TIGR00645 family)